MVLSVVFFLVGESQVVTSVSIILVVWVLVARRKSRKEFAIQNAKKPDAFCYICIYFFVFFNCFLS